MVDSVSEPAVCVVYVAVQPQTGQSDHADPCPPPEDRGRMCYVVLEKAYYCVLCLVEDTAGV